MTILCSCIWLTLFLLCIVIVEAASREKVRNEGASKAIYNTTNIKFTRSEEKQPTEANLVAQSHLRLNRSCLLSWTRYYHVSIGHL